jgi:exopolysaccharide biosynthesis polyprenyl glycosylphosphotransferase
MLDSLRELRTMIATGPARVRPTFPRNGDAKSVAGPKASERKGLISPPAGARAPARSHTELFRLTDTTVVLLVMGTAFLVTNHREIGDLEHFLSLRITLKNVVLFVAFLVVWQRIFTATHRPWAWSHPERRTELAQVGLACTMAALLVAMVPLTGLSRSFGLPAVMLFWVTAVPATLAVRQAARAVASVAARATRPRQVIIVGSGPLAHAAYQRISACPESRCHVLGFVDTNPRIVIPDVRERHLGELRHLERFLMHSPVDLVVIALPVKSQYSSIQETIRVCERVGVESQYLANIFQGERARHEYGSEAGIPSVAMKVVHDDVRTVIKRVFDVTAGGLGLIALAPLLAAIAVAIRLTSPGPIFFVQERYGLNRRIFRMYKFRTMVANAEGLQLALEHLNEAAGPVFKIRDDPRITAMGRFLRRTSLDELPQLINVVTGDMSLVGPRPLPLRDVRHFSEGALMRRFSVRPGLTGLWQVSGRSGLGFEDWIRLDLQYIDRWSISLDLKILLRTVPAVMRGEGAC